MPDIGDDEVVRSATERAEAVVDRLERSVGQVAARVRTEAAAMWAEAQSIHHGRPADRALATPRTAVATVATVAQHAYCVKCKEQRPLTHPHHVTLKNRRPALQGPCAVCGTTLTRILPRT